jgi:transcription elongation factor SPT4
VLRCTTSAYAGTVAIIDPAESWMSRYVHVGAGAKPGVYAMAVTGTFDKEVLDSLVERGVKWRCRPAGFVAGK